MLESSLLHVLCQIRLVKISHVAIEFLKLWIEETALVAQVVELPFFFFRLRNGLRVLFKIHVFVWLENSPDHQKMLN